MQLGVFLDIDGVLTDEPINMQLGRMLNVDAELKEIEDNFNKGYYDNTKFNQKFIPLFNKAKFNDKFVEEHYDDLQMRLSYEDLIKACPDTHLVSSGPSYFVDVLAERHNIPKERVLCSRYSFDDKGLLRRCTRAVSPAVKGNYVRKRVSDERYTVTVGVGDNPVLDIPFLSHCKIKILTGGLVADYLYAREIQPIIDVIQLLQSTGNSQHTKDQEFSEALAKLHKVSGAEKNVFIMTPFREKSDARYRELIRSIKDELEINGYKGWVASDLTLVPQLWDNVRAFMIGCPFAIAVFTQDGGGAASYNPNVAVELGFMLSRYKETLLLKDKETPELFTDLTGFLNEEFDLENAEKTVRPIVKRWVESNLS